MVFMRVAAFVHVSRTLHTWEQTGVGKHIDNMVPRLAAAPGVDLCVLTAQEDLTPDGGLPAESSLAGIPVRPVTWPRRLVEMSWALLDYPAAERWTGPVDWVYCPADAYVSRRSARLAVTIHSVLWFERELPWYRELRRVRWAYRPRYYRCKKRADVIFTVSEFLKGRLIDLFGMPADRIVIVGNGVEDGYFQASPLVGPLAVKVGDRPYVLVVGELAPHKGIDYVFALAEALLRRNSEVQILVAGTIKEPYSTQAREHPNIRQLGYVGLHTGLPGLLHSSVALLLLSRHESFGIPAAEAMAAGTPAIVSHFAALPEVVGDAGLVVDPTRPDDLADLVEMLHRDGRQREEYVNRGRRRAEAFRWQYCADRALAAMRAR